MLILEGHVFMWIDYKKDDHENNDNLRKTVVKTLIAKLESQKKTLRGVLINFTEQGSMIKQKKHSQ